MSEQIGRRRFLVTATAAGAAVVAGPAFAEQASATGGSLQAGTSRIDVAAFRQKGYTKTGIGVGWFTASGVPAGWTHQMVSAPLLDQDRAVVRDGRLAPDGPSYKVLFVASDVTPQD